METTSCVLAAVDYGPSAVRVLRHAAGFARLFSVPLQILHVSTDTTPEHAQRLLDFCIQHGPYEVDFTSDDIVLRSGLISEAIYREAVRQHARMVVMGSSGPRGLAKWVLGSTTEMVLREAPAPVLLVPPIDFDIVNITDRATLTCGPVLAPIDLAEACEDQLRLAGELAHEAGQPLLLLTVPVNGVDDHKAGAMLRERGHGASTKPHAMIVRRGGVAKEISRCALAEGAGLVVMGLRERGRGRPGAIASAVLETNRAFVLAVPRA
jgi:nucleotide-binding universal stress UspA family protein